MKEFTYNALPGHIIFGAGKLQSLADEIDRLGCSLEQWWHARVILIMGKISFCLIAQDSCFYS